MKEYIEREPLLAFLYNTQTMSRRMVIECLENRERFPAADVEPVRHGEWIGRYGNGGYDDYYCSICGMYEEGTRNPKFLGNYCPNCGAKMDGGTVNEQNT